MWTKQWTPYGLFQHRYIVDGELALQITEHTCFDTRYRGYVWKINHPVPVKINDDDLEVIKLKCLVRAKELGWDIKSIKQ